MVAVFHIIDVIKNVLEPFGIVTRSNSVGLGKQRRDPLSSMTRGTVKYQLARTSMPEFVASGPYRSR
jgi:hypothetical protein